MKSVKSETILYPHASYLFSHTSLRAPLPHTTTHPRGPLARPRISLSLTCAGGHPMALFISKFELNSNTNEYLTYCYLYTDCYFTIAFFCSVPGRVSSTFGWSWVALSWLLPDRDSTAALQSGTRTFLFSLFCTDHELFSLPISFFLSDICSSKFFCFAKQAKQIFVRKFCRFYFILLLN